MEVSGPLGAERHLKKSLKNMAKGRDPSTLGEMIWHYEDQPAPKVPIEVDWQFLDDGVRRAMAKMAYLGAAALLERENFSQVDTEALRLAVQGEKSPELMVAPKGAMGLKRLGHGISLHLLPDGRLGALVTLFSVLWVLVPVGKIMGPLPTMLPAVVILPLPGDETVHHIDSPNLDLVMDSHPEVLPDFLFRALELQLAEVQMQGTYIRAWHKAGLPGDPLPPERLVELTPKQRHAFEQLLVTEQAEMDVMRLRDDVER